MCLCKGGGRNRLFFSSPSAPFFSFSSSSSTFLPGTRRLGRIKKKKKKKGEVVNGLPRVLHTNDIQEEEEWVDPVYPGGRKNFFSSSSLLRLLLTKCENNPSAFSVRFTSVGTAESDDTQCIIIIRIKNIFDLE